MTAPTEAEIRAFMESNMGDWTLDTNTDEFSESASAFQAFVDGRHITDDDLGVFIAAHVKALRAFTPAIVEALRPFLIEANVRGAMAFFEHYPDAPLAKRAEPVTA